METQVKQVMADVLKIQPTSISDATAVDNTANWDSLRHIDLCLALEQEFGVILEVAEMEKMLSYAEIMRVLRRKTPGES